MTFPNGLHGGYKKANKMGRVPRKGGPHKKGKKKNFQIFFFPNW